MRNRFLFIAGASCEVGSTIGLVCHHFLKKDETVVDDVIEVKKDVIEVEPKRFDWTKEQSEYMMEEVKWHVSTEALSKINVWKVRCEWEGGILMIVKRENGSYRFSCYDPRIKTWLNSKKGYIFRS